MISRELECSKRFALMHRRSGRSRFEIKNIPQIDEVREGPWKACCVRQGDNDENSKPTMTHSRQ
jgi:hypothetical protein